MWFYHCVYWTFWRSFENVSCTLLSLLNSYFGSLIIEILNREGRLRFPSFTLDMWTYYDHLKSDLLRTNNNVEGWSTGFSVLLTSSHSKIWIFINNCLKTEKSIDKMTIKQLLAGNVVQQLKNSKKTYTKTKRILFRVCKDFESRLLNISFCVCFTISIWINDF